MSQNLNRHLRAQVVCKHCEFSSDYNKTLATVIYILILLPLLVRSQERHTLMHSLFSVHGSYVSSCQTTALTGTGKTALQLHNIREIRLCLTIRYVVTAACPSHQSQHILHSNIASRVCSASEHVCGNIQVRNHWMRSSGVNAAICHMTGTSHPSTASPCHCV